MGVHKTCSENKNKKNVFRFSFSLGSTMAFRMGNSDHVVVSVSIDFPSNSKRDALFQRIVYDY